MVKLDLNTAFIEAKLRNLQKIPQHIMPPTFQYFKNATPKKSGNARANTVMQGNVIYANYPYAAVLDAGRGFRDGQMRGSVQAPYGMTQPTINLFMKALAQAEADAIMNQGGNP